MLAQSECAKAITYMECGNYVYGVWSSFGMGDAAGPPFGVPPRPGDGGGSLAPQNAGDRVPARLYLSLDLGCL